MLDTVGKFTKGDAKMKLPLRFKLLTQGVLLLFGASSATIAVAGDPIRLVNHIKRIALWRQMP